MLGITTRCTAWTGEGDCEEKATYNITVIQDVGGQKVEYKISRCTQHTAELQRRLPGVIVAPIEVEPIAEEANAHL